MLGDLRGRGLLQRDADIDDVRYRMLESIRAHLAAERPARHTAELQDAHASWALRLAERADAGLHTHGQSQWWIRLERDLWNLRSAIDHGLHGGDPNQALAIAGHLSWFWYRRGDVAAGRALLHRTLAAAPDAPPAVRMRGNLGVALLSYLAGDLAAFDDATAAVLDDGGEPGADVAALAQAWTTAAFVAALRGDVPQARAALRAAHAIARPGWLRCRGRHGRRLHRRCGR